MIRIFSCLLFLCLMHSSAHAHDISLQWDHNTDNHIEGYYVYYGNASGNYPWYEPVGLGSCHDDVCEINLDLPDGQWYIAVTAYNMYDMESDFSNEVYTELPSPSICLGDFDQDGDVDAADLSIMVYDFGRSDCSAGSPCLADFDSDGDVDGADLVIFSGEFGRTDCPVYP